METGPGHVLVADHITSTIVMIVKLLERILSVPSSNKIMSVWNVISAINSMLITSANNLITQPTIILIMVILRIMVILQIMIRILTTPQISITPLISIIQRMLIMVRILITPLTLIIPQLVPTLKTVYNAMPLPAPSVRRDIYSNITH